MAQLKAGQQQYKLLSPSGYGMIRLYHNNITANHRKLVAGKVKTPALVTRAKLIQRQQRLVPVLFQETQDLT